MADVLYVARACIESNDETLIQFATVDCRKNIAALDWEIADVAEHLLQLAPAGYRGSQWCERSSLPGTRWKPAQRWLPCDAYMLKAMSVNRTTGWRTPVEYYFKLCLWPNGNLVFMLSVHT